MKSIIIPEGVTSIGDFAFKDCESLVSIDIPNSVTSIGDYAFSGCFGLLSMTILSENPPIMASDVFGGVNRDIEIKIPYGSISKYKKAEFWSEFTNYIEC